MSTCPSLLASSSRKTGVYHAIRGIKGPPLVGGLGATGSDQDVVGLSDGGCSGRKHLSRLRNHAIGACHTSPLIFTEIIMSRRGSIQGRGTGPWALHSPSVEHSVHCVALTENPAGLIAPYEHGLPGSDKDQSPYMYHQ